MKERDATRAEAVTHAERCLGILSVPGRMARDELESPPGLDREDGAVIPAGEGVGKSAGLGRVEEEDVVGIGQECLTPPCTPEDAPPDQNDAVRWVWLFGSIRLYMRAAPEVHDRNAERLEE
jgi:hypothetical protein